MPLSMQLNKKPLGQTMFNSIGQAETTKQLSVFRHTISTFLPRQSPEYEGSLKYLKAAAARVRSAEPSNAAGVDNSSRVLRHQIDSNTCKSLRNETAHL